MGLLKRTYVLPLQTLEQFERNVSAGQRSAVIARLIDEWLEEERLAQLRRDIIEGCREMADVYLEIEAEYNPLEEEVYHVLDT